MKINRLYRLQPILALVLDDIDSEGEETTDKENEDPPLVD